MITERSHNSVYFQKCIHLALFNYLMGFVREKLFLPPLALTQKWQNFHIFVNLNITTTLKYFFWAEQFFELRCNTECAIRFLIGNKNFWITLELE